MDTVTYPEPRVASFIGSHCVAVKIRVKENRRLLEEYLVSWTPHVVLADDEGRVHHRVEGYLPPELFVARLSLGVGKYRLARKQFAQAAERFEEVAQRHAGSEAGAEALYWLGVARYKEAHDPAPLHLNWQRIAREYPDSEWAERTRIPDRS